MIVKFSKIISAVLAAFSVISNAQAQIPGPEVFGALPDVVEVAVSPDGSTLAMLHNVNGESAVFFVDIDNPEGAPGGIRVGGANTREIQWVDNDHLLVLASISDRVRTNKGLEAMEFFRWLSVSKSRQEAVQLFGNSRNFFIGSAGTLMSTLPGDPEHALFARSAPPPAERAAPGSVGVDLNSSIYYSLMKANLDTGRVEHFAEGNDRTQDWIVDSDGSVAARIDYNRTRNNRDIYVPDGNSYRLAHTFEVERGIGAALSITALARAPNIFLATGSKGGETRKLFEFNVDTGEYGPTLFSNPKHDLNGVSYNQSTARVTAAWYTDDMPRKHNFDEADNKLQQQIAAAIPGAAPVIVSKSDDGTRFVLELSYANHPRQFFLFDKRTNRLDHVGSAYNALDGNLFAAKEPFEYTASDGQRIPGYLTVPKKYATGAVTTPGPLIVHPHGGPESRSDQSYDYWSFFYAANGYYVYEPNFRGSEGYGYDFRDAGFGEWGRRMQDDISEGVRALIASGKVDPNRICIVGASYGGYAALAGATLTPDLYACSVSVNGVTDLNRMLEEEGRSSDLSEDYWKVRIGDRKNSRDQIAAVSPVNLAQNVKAPVLLIHSIDDAVVPIRQSLEMRNALRNAGKTVEYIELKGEDHWMSTGESRTEMLKGSFEFIEQHIGE